MINVIHIDLLVMISNVNDLNYLRNIAFDRANWRRIQA